MSEHEAPPIFVQDVTLRDGMHAVRHRITPDDVRRIVTALDAAGVDAIEVAHGDGLAGGSVNYGPGSPHRLGVDRGRGRASSSNARLTTLLLPGIGTIEELKHAYDLGVRSVRIATHCTEADVSAQHIATARELGMDVSGFLMMSHMAPAEELAEAGQADGVLRRALRLRHRLRRPADDERRRASGSAPTATCSTRAPRSASTPTRTSRSRSPTPSSPSRTASTASTPRSPGTAPARATARSSRSSPSPTSHGWEHGCDLFALQDAADDIVRPLQDRPVRVDRETLTLGYAGVYSSFLRHAEAASARYGVDVRDAPARGRPAPAGRRPGGHDRRHRARPRRRARGRRQLILARSRVTSTPRRTGPAGAAWGLSVLRTPSRRQWCGESARMVRRVGANGAASRRQWCGESAPVAPTRATTSPDSGDGGGGRRGDPSLGPCASPSRR